MKFIPQSPFPSFQSVTPLWQEGQKLICVDDEGWLQEPDYPHLTPKKGQIYTLREYTRQFGAPAVSLIEGHQDHYYRACRFKPAS